MPRRAPEQPSHVSGSRGLSRASSVTGGVLARPTSAELAKPAIDNAIIAEGARSQCGDSAEAQIKDLERRLQEQNHLYWESARRKEDDLQAAKTEARNLQQLLQELQQKHKESEFSANAEMEKLQNAEETLRSEYSKSLDFEVNCVCELQQELKDEGDKYRVEARELRGHQESCTQSLAEVRAEMLEQHEGFEAEHKISAQVRAELLEQRERFGAECKITAQVRAELLEQRESLEAEHKITAQVRSELLEQCESLEAERKISSQAMLDNGMLSDAKERELQEAKDNAVKRMQKMVEDHDVRISEVFKKQEEDIREVTKKLGDSHQQQIGDMRAKHEAALIEQKANHKREMEELSNELQAASNRLKEVQHQEQRFEDFKSQSSEDKERLRTELNDYIHRSSMDTSKLRLRADEATSCFRRYEAEASSQREMVMMELAKERQGALEESQAAKEEGRLAAMASEQSERAKIAMQQAEQEWDKKAAEAREIEEQLRTRIINIRDEVIVAKEAERAAQDGREAAQQCAARHHAELQEAIVSEQACAKAEKAITADHQKLKIEVKRQLQSHEEALAQKDADLRELRSHTSRQLEKVRLSTEEWAANEAKRERDLEVANQTAAKANRKIEELRSELAQAQSKTQKLSSNEKDLKQARAEADHCARLTHSLEAQLDETREKLRRAELRQEAKGEELEALKARSASLQNQMQDLRGKLSAERLTRHRSSDPGKGDMWLYSESTGFFAPGGAQPSKSCGATPGEPQKLLPEVVTNSGDQALAKRSQSVGELPRPAPPMPVPGSHKGLVPPPGGPSLRMGWATNARGASREGRPGKIEKIYCK